MKLGIILENHKGSVVLTEGERTVASRDFAVDADLSQKLLLEIDALLSCVQVQASDLEHVSCTANDAGLTTTRIGNVVANTFNFMLEKRCRVF